MSLLPACSSPCAPNIPEALSVLGESTELVSKDVKGRQHGKSRAKRQAFTEDERRIAGVRQGGDVPDNISLNLSYLSS